MKVLLVDDEPEILAVLKPTLKLRCDVETANNAVNALNTLHAAAFDVVVTDYDMPGQNGIWLLEQIQSQFPSMRRIMFTGRGLLNGAPPPELLPFVKSGLVQRFLAKPVRIEDVWNAIIAQS